MAILKAVGAKVGPGKNGLPDHDPEEVIAEVYHDPEEVIAEVYIAIESYQAGGPGQISFKEGEKVHVLDKEEDGRWTCHGLARKRR